MILVILLFSLRTVHISSSGVTYAILSGALASGVGYTVWYAALRGLSTTRAATVQLSVPVIAAWSGVIFLAEQVSARLWISGILILGGIALALSGRATKG
jgi:drug/metabolite transporter (DMT)-like permease